MSRNSEKSQSSLHRFQAYKAQLGGAVESNPNMRPRSVKQCQSLAQAEKWRSVVLKEINSRLTRINDTSLNDYQIRDINDELNALIKESKAWEYRIKELNGADYVNVRTARLAGVPHLAALGYSLRGYKYFGRAKELEGVREIIEFQQKQKREAETAVGAKQTERQGVAKALRELEERVDATYYGLDERPPVDLLEMDALMEDLNQRFGGEVFSVVDSEPSCGGGSEMLAWETKHSQAMRRELRSESGEEPILLDDSEFDIPDLAAVEAVLVARRRQELREKLGI